MRASYASIEDALAAVGDPRTELPFRCHKHDDTQASASVNKVLGVWYCYACHAAGKADEVVIDTDAKELLAEVSDLLGEDLNISERMIELYQSETSYWRERGFTKRAIEHFQLGYDPISRTPCYPMRRPDGSLVGFVRRNLDAMPKYLYPRRVSKRELLFNYSPEHREVVTLVEGALDVVAAWDAGVQAFGIYGSKLSLPQVELIHKISPSKVLLAFDNDDAGHAATEAAARLLDLHYEVWRFPWHEWRRYNDLAEMPLKVRRHALSDVMVAVSPTV